MGGNKGGKEGEDYQWGQGRARSCKGANQSSQSVPHHDNYNPSQPVTYQERMLHRDLCLSMSATDGRHRGTRTCARC